MAYYKDLREYIEVLEKKSSCGPDFLPAVRLAGGLRIEVCGQEVRRSGGQPPRVS